MFTPESRRPGVLLSLRIRQVLAAVFLIAGVLVVILAWTELSTLDELGRQGRVTSAWVQAVEGRTVTFMYVVKGEAYQGRDVLPVGTSVKQGALLTVTYLPRDPTVAALAAKAHQQIAIAGVVAAVAMFVLGGLLLRGTAWRRAR